MNILKIVITGGVCGGKTSSLPIVSQALSERGYSVIIIEESATEVINSGLDLNKITPKGFQKLLLKHHLEKEENALKNLDNTKEYVILYDRAIVDVKPFVGEKIFQEILQEEKLEESDVFSKYNAVFHLETIANSKEQLYTQKNNTARKENIEQAKINDQKTQAAWCKHSRFKVIKNQETFEKKVDILIEEILLVIQEFKSKL